MNFRRVVTALAVLALFAGLASAQVPQPTPITCTVGAGAAPTIRTEGLTERAGDIILTCTGGPQPSRDAAVDRATITVDYGYAVTSKTDASGTGAVCNGNPAGCSEAMLLIDEPNSVSGAAASAIQGYGAGNANVSVCTTPQQLTSPLPAACVAYAEQVTAGYWVMTAATIGGGTATTGASPTPAAAANAYQGQNGTGSSGNGISTTKVVFSNVPILAPYTGNVQRIYRITNVRLNGTTLTAGGAVTPTVTVTPNAGAGTTLSLSNNNPTVATAQSSLTTAVTPVGGISLCVSGQLNPSASQGKANAALLTFTEKFAGAFKTRVLPLSNQGSGTSQAYASQAGDAETNGTNQNPGSSANSASIVGGVTGTFTLGSGSNAVSYSSYNSESGQVLSATSGLVGGNAAGLASSGTRLKAVFANLDPKASYYVSVNPLVDYNTTTTLPTTGAGDNSAIPWAALLTKGTNGDTTTGGSLETQTYTITTSAGGVNTALNPNATTQVQVALLSKTGSSSNAAEAVWEVTNITPGSVFSLNFGVYAVYSAANAPATGNTATVQLGYAPTTASSGAASTAIPRYSAPSAAAATFFNVIPCQTVLMFPYVTNVTGYETGIAISNTSADPFTTTPTTGSCNMYFYGTNQPTTGVPFTSGTGATSIGGGGQIANTASGLGLTNFSGYAIAVCSFQYAHGFAFVQTKSQTLGMGYLALVMAGNSRAESLIGETFSQ